MQPLAKYCMAKNENDNQNEKETSSTKTKLRTKTKTITKTKKLPCTLFNSVRGYNTPSIKLNLNSIPCVARAMQLNW